MKLMKKGYGQLKANMWNNHFWVNITNPSILKYTYKSILIKSGFNILQEMEYHFKPYGYTAIFLLSDSHLAIHTFPEKNKTYIEITSCVKNKYNRFIKLKNENLKNKGKNGHART